MTSEKESGVVVADETSPATENAFNEKNASASQKDTLVIYFSRTGKTRTIAEKIAKFLDASIEEVVGEEDFSGVWGALKLSYRALMKTRSPLKNPPRVEPWHKAIWIGGPVHASSLASPLFTWIEDNKDLLKQEGREIFLFGTEGGSGHDGMFTQAENIIGVKALKKVSVFRRDVETFDPEKYLKIGEEKQENDDQSTGDGDDEDDEKQEAK